MTVLSIFQVYISFFHIKPPQAKIYQYQFALRFFSSYNAVVLFYASLTAKTSFHTQNAANEGNRCYFIKLDCFDSSLAILKPYFSPFSTLIKNSSLFKSFCNDK